MELGQVVAHFVQRVNSTMLQKVQVAPNVFPGHIKTLKDKRNVCHVQPEHTVQIKELNQKLYAPPDITVLVE